MEKFNPYGKFAGVLVPLWILVRIELSFPAKIMYGLLMKHAGKDGRCFPGEAKLAKEMGIVCGGKYPEENATRSVRRYLTELVAHGLIETKQPGLHQTNRYFFLIHEWMDEAADRTYLSDQDQTILPAHDRTDMSDRRNKKSKKAALSAAMKKRTPEIILKNQRDHDLHQELLSSFGESIVQQAAQDVHMSGMQVYLSNIAKLLKYKHSVPALMSTNGSNNCHGKNLKASRHAASANQSIAKQLLQERSENRHTSQ